MENICDDEVEKDFLQLCRTGRDEQVSKLLNQLAVDVIHRGVFVAVEHRNRKVSLLLARHCIHGMSGEVQGDLMRAVCRAGDWDQFCAFSEEMTFSMSGVDDEGCSAIHHACRGGSEAITRALVERFSLDPSTLTEGGWCALHFALRSGNVALCRYLTEELHFNPLKLASASFHLGFAEDSLFSNHQAPSPSRARKALTLSRSSGLLRGMEDNWDIHEQHDDDRPETRDRLHDGWTLLHWACASGSLEAVSFILKALDVAVAPSSRLASSTSPSVNRRPRNGMSSPHLSHASSALGALAGEVDHSGQTALHIAASAGSPAVIAFLIQECRANPNASDYAQRTPLHVACERGDVPVIRMLLANGAKPQRNAQGRMPYDEISYFSPLHDEVRFLCDCYNPETLSFHYAVPFSTVSKYCVQEHEIGRGKFGTVFKGELFGTPVAIKTFSLAIDDEQARDYFKHEVGLLSRIHHPNITCFLAACIQHPGLCLVMELCTETCRSAIERNDALSCWENRMRWSREIAQAMCWLHSQSPFILHRDLKTNNVLLTDHGQAKVSDFGLSSVEHNVALKSVYARTLPAGERSSKKGDVFQFGLILLEFFCGSVASALSFADMLNQCRHLLSSIASDKVNVWPQHLDLVDKLTSLVPSQRPAFSAVVESLPLLLKDLEKSTFEEFNTHFATHGRDSRLDSDAPPPVAGMFNPRASGTFGYVSAGGYLFESPTKKSKVDL